MPRQATEPQDMISGSSLCKFLSKVGEISPDRLDYCVGLIDNEERMCASVLRLLENPNALAIRQKKVSALEFWVVVYRRMYTSLFARFHSKLVLNSALEYRWKTIPRH